MDFIYKCFVISCFILASLNIFSNEAPPKIINTEEKSLLWEDFKSPITTNAIYFLTTGLIVSTLIGNDDRSLDDQAKAQAEFNPLLEDWGYVGETIGWGYLNGLYILSFGLHGYYNNDKKSKERSEIMFSSSTMTLFMTSILKTTINRSRPSFPSKKDSFPSGHASMAFNFASVVTAEHGAYWGVPAFALATFISYSRVNDGWHWVTDVVAGATIGVSYGLGVYYNRRKENPNYWFSILPGEEKNSVQAVYTLNFQ